MSSSLSLNITFIMIITSSLIDILSRRFLLPPPVSRTTPHCAAPSRPPPMVTSSEPPKLGHLDLVRVQHTSVEAKSIRSPLCVPHRTVPHHVPYHAPTSDLRLPL